MSAGANVLLSTGVGFTVTTTFSTALEQPFAVVIYAYVTAIGAVVVFVNVSLIAATTPLLADSDIPKTTARLQAKVGLAVALVAV